jgi:hypothetical protein
MMREIPLVDIRGKRGKREGRGRGRGGECCEDIDRYINPVALTDRAYSK